jgi:hypothetical protein
MSEKAITPVRNKMVIQRAGTRIVDAQIKALVDNAINTNKHYIKLNSDNEEAYLIVIPRIDNPTVAHVSLHLGTAEEIEAIYSDAMKAEDDLQIDQYLVATRLQSDILWIKDELSDMELDEATAFFHEELEYDKAGSISVLTFIIATLDDDENIDLYTSLLNYYKG